MIEGKVIAGLVEFVEKLCTAWCTITTTYLCLSFCHTDNCYLKDFKIFVSVSKATIKCIDLMTKRPVI